MRLSASFLLLALSAWGHDIITTNLTFTRDISRIFDRHCASCHGPNADVPLSTYEQARPWAVAIKEQVLARSMPPWGAVKGFGDLNPDHALSQEDIMIVAAWVIGGAPKGDPVASPKQARGRAASAPPELKIALTAENGTTLESPIELAGVRAVGEHTIESARITARLPDGSIVPLVWLYQYDPGWKRAFLFRERIALPKGSAIETSTPMRIELLE